MPSGKLERFALVGARHSVAEQFLADGGANVDRLMLGQPRLVSTALNVRRRSSRAMFDRQQYASPVSRHRSRLTSQSARAPRRSSSLRPSRYRLPLRYTASLKPLGAAAEAKARAKTARFRADPCCRTPALVTECPRLRVMAAAVCCVCRHIGFSLSMYCV